MFKTIDFQVSGQGLRLVAEGWPAPSGSTMRDRQAHARARHDRHRRLLMCEPRGHEGLTGALLTVAERPSSVAGVLFMHDGGWMDLCGHGVLAVARHLAMGPAEFAIDTPAGTVTARVTGTRAAVVVPPARVIAPGAPVALERRAVAVDVVQAVGTYAIVDGEAAGVPLVEARRLELARAAAAITRVLTKVDKVVPAIEAVVFTGPPSTEGGGADMRAITVCEGGVMDRSPGGLASAALLAVVDAMGLADPARPFVVEGPRGTTMQVRLHARVALEGAAAIVPEISAEVFQVGESTWYADR
jgi:proline racemase